MNLLVLACAALFAFAGQQTAADGTISGVLKNAEGRPAAGVRIAAMAVPGVEAAANEGDALVSITQTDKTGRYVLEGVPPGRYYITAGLVTSPTFYPGVTKASSTSVVTVSAGGALTGYDFTAINALKTPEDALIPVRIVMDDGSPVPAIPWMVTATRANSYRTVMGYSVSLRLPEGQYQIAFRAAQSPDLYEVKSTAYGNAELRAGALTVDDGPPRELVFTLKSKRVPNP